MLAFLAKGLMTVAILLVTVISGICGLLPDSPFYQLQLYVDDMNILGFVNYFIPFDLFILILDVWLPCVIIYYAYRLITRGILANIPVVGKIFEN